MFLKLSKNIIEEEGKALLLLSKSLDIDYNKILNLISKASGNIILSGVGKSGHIARKIASTLTSTGTPAYFIHPTEASHGDLGSIRKKDILCLLSKSGKSKELLDLLYFAKKNKIKSIAFLDHWVNYKERFIYKNTLQMPDELWVVDKYAFEIATNKFSNIPIKIVDDFYLKDQLKLINEPALESNQLLYILEPIRDNWGKSIQGEFQALDYFFRNIHKLELPKNTIIVLRPHPSESRSKYEIYIKKNHDYKVKIESDNITLANSISSSKWVAGCQSYAMSIAIAANRNVICSLPPVAPYCKLPHINIKHLKEI